MSEKQSTAELTTRDVFLQVDHRLTRIEDDLRALDTKMENRFVSVEARFSSMEERMDRRFSSIDGRFTNLEARFSGIDSKFQWMLGIVLASWLSLMGTLLLK